MKKSLIAFSLLMGLALINSSQGMAADRVVFLGSPIDSMQARIDLIQRAKNEIYIQMYEVGDEKDFLSETALGLLLEKAADNVEVNLVMDSMHAYMNNSTLQILTSYPHFHIKLFNHFDILNPLLYNKRMHNKLMVADGMQAIVGGRNTTTDYYNLNCSNVKHNYWDTDLLILGDGSPLSAPMKYFKYSKDFFQNGRLVENIKIDPSELINFTSPISMTTTDEVINQSLLGKQASDGTVYSGAGTAAKDSLYFLRTAKKMQKSINLAKINLFSNLEIFKNYELISTKSSSSSEITSSGEFASESDDSLQKNNEVDSAIQKNTAEALTEFINLKNQINSSRSKACTVSNNNEPIFQLKYNHSKTLNDNSNLWELDWGKTAENVGTSLALTNDPFRTLDPNDKTNVAHQIWKIVETEFSEEKISALPEGINPSLTIVSPYFSLTKGFRQTLLKAKSSAEKFHKKLEINLLTNSQKTTDVNSTQDCFEQEALPEYLNLGAKIYFFNGTLDQLTKIGRLHQKTFIINKSKFIFGSFNSDYRSSEINLEIAYYFDTSQTESPNVSSNNLSSNINKKIDILINNSTLINQEQPNFNGMILSVLGLCKQM